MNHGLKRRSIAGKVQNLLDSAPGVLDIQSELPSMLDHGLRTTRQDRQARTDPGMLMPGVEDALNAQPAAEQPPQQPGAQPADADLAKRQAAVAKGEADLQMQQKLANDPRLKSIKNMIDKGMNPADAVAANDHPQGIVKGSQSHQALDRIRKDVERGMPLDRAIRKAGNTIFTAPVNGPNADAEQRAKEWLRNFGGVGGAADNYQQYAGKFTKEGGQIVDRYSGKPVMTEDEMAKGGKMTDHGWVSYAPTGPEGEGSYREILSMPPVREQALRSDLNGLRYGPAWNQRKGEALPDLMARRAGIMQDAANQKTAAQFPQDDTQFPDVGSAGKPQGDLVFDTTGTTGKSGTSKTAFDTSGNQVGYATIPGYVGTMPDLASTGTEQLPDQQSYSDSSETI